MMNTDRTFQNAVNRFVELKAKFSGFCNVCAECFDGNEHFPGVSVELRQNVAILHAFDRSFEMTCAPMPERVGVLSVHLVEGDERILMVRWYFDRLGNVKRELGADWGFDSLTEKDFVAQVGNAVTKAYAAHVEAAGEPSSA